jgi:hypothetical protein
VRPDVAKVDVGVQVDLVAKADNVSEKRHILAAEGSIVLIEAKHVRDWDWVRASGEDQLGGFLRKLLHHLALYASEAKTESLNFKATVLVCLKLGLLKHVDHKLGRHLLGGIRCPDAFQLSR